MKPFLKWVGGKTQLLGNIFEHFPKTINNYHEPFLGGGSVLLKLLDSPDIEITGKIYVSDLNKALIGLYQNIQMNVELFIECACKIQNDYNNCPKESNGNRKPKDLQEAMKCKESFYYFIRDEFNKSPDKTDINTSAMFMFLNKTSWRGVWREGPNGYNVPFGNYVNPAIISPNSLRVISSKIQNVVFKCQSFIESLDSVKPHDFVYLDPPYAPETKISFTSYNKSGFNLDNHKELFSKCHQLRQDGAIWLLSNSSVSLVLDAFPKESFDIFTIPAHRFINSKKPGSMVNEVLITFKNQ